MSRCNLPPALLAERLSSIMCHCSNTGTEQTPNKSQHTKLTPEKKIFLPLLPGFELATFRSQVRHSTNNLSLDMLSKAESPPAKTKFCCLLQVLATVQQLLHYPCPPRPYLTSDSIVGSALLKNVFRGLESCATGTFIPFHVRDFEAVCRGMFSTG